MSSSRQNYVIDEITDTDYGHNCKAIMDNEKRRLVPRTTVSFILVKLDGIRQYTRRGPRFDARLAFLDSLSINQSLQESRITHTTITEVLMWVTIYVDTLNTVGQSQLPHIHWCHCDFNTKGSVTCVAKDKCMCALTIMVRYGHYDLRWCRARHWNRNWPVWPLHKQNNTKI